MTKEKLLVRNFIRYFFYGIMKVLLDCYLGISILRVMVDVV